MKRTLPRWLYWIVYALFALFVVWAVVDLWRMTAADLAMNDLPAWGVALNLVLRTLPLVLLLFVSWIIFRVVTEEGATGTMTQRTRRLLFWTPRVAALLFAAFLSLFALDVFQADAPVLEILGALFVHLIPVFIMLAGIAIAWRYEWVGAAVFIGWALFYLFSARGFDASVYVSIAGLPFAMGVLFLLNWIYRAQVHPAAPAASPAA